jgi:peptidoglycan biosynthesis protein MviN/MurJ (putative lipid II flippase)
MLAFKATGIWLLILVCAVLNGIFREAVLLPHLGKVGALVLSGILLSVCIVVLALLLVPRLGRLGTRQGISLGVLWLGLTLAFEFGFGRLVQHRPWPELLQAYTFEDGNLWPIVLVVTLVAPLAVIRLRGTR